MAKKPAPFSKTKLGQVSKLRWSYVTSIKMGYPVSKEEHLEKILNIVTKGTRFQEHIDAINSAKQIRRKKKK